MRLQKKHFMWASVLGVAVLLLVTGPLHMSAFGKDTIEWKWPKGYKTPIWWTWGDDYEKTKPVRGGYFRTAATKYIGLMNPNHWPVNDWVAMTYIYEMMIYNDHKFQPMVPWLAESWEYTDPLTCVMKLRKGVTFHDGTKYNAENLRYQIAWIQDKVNGCWSRSWIDPVKSVEVIDEHTVKWHFHKPWGSFTGILANVPGYTISKKALEGDVALREADKLIKKIKTAKKKLARAEKKAQKAQAMGGESARKAIAKAEKARKKVAQLEKEHAKWVAASKGHKKTDVNPVATGKYMLEEGKPGNYLKLKRNPNWWFAKKVGLDMPYFDGILIKVIPDPSVRLATAKAGKLDSIYIEKWQYNIIKDDPDFKVYSYPGNHNRGIWLNHAKGPCRDIRVRKAISHAIDRKAIISGTQFGLGIEASCMYPECHWAHNPNLKPVTYDPELSKKLLAEAGYPNGLTLKGHCDISNEARNRALAQKEMLAKVGINWEFDALDSAASTDRFKNLDYDIASGGWTWILDPDLMATSLYTPQGGWNYNRSKNEKAIPLINAAREETDMNKRQKMYWDIEKALYENYEDVWIFWPMDLTVFRKNVMGWNQKHYLAGREGQWFSHCRWFKDGHP